MEKFFKVCCLIFALSPSFILADYAKLREDFVNPPREALPQTWWHFTNNAITKEGISADLKAMKEFGYSAAHLFLLGQNSFRSMPKLEVPSECWDDFMRHIGNEARNLDFDLGAHNCPGWSSSGGIWIKPEDAMKYVVASETRVNGAYKGKLKLARPRTVEGFYRDIEVQAFQTPPQMPTPKISGNIKDPQNILNFDETSHAKLPIKNAKSEPVILEFPSPFPARALEFYLDRMFLYLDATVSASEDGKVFEKIGALRLAVHNDIKSPKIIDFGRIVNAKFFKLEFDTSTDSTKPKELKLTSLRLLSTPMTSDLDNRVAISSSFNYSPPQPNLVNEKGIDPSKVLKFKISSGDEVDVDLPEGTWLILRIGYTCTGAKNAPTAFKGLECDKLSRRGLDAHWEHYIGKLLRDFGASMKFATIDSFEVRGQNWTEDFAQEFKKRRGYDISPWLPAMVGYLVEDRQACAKFYYDLHRTVSDLFAENYFDYFTELCHKNGLQSILEPYGGMFDSLRCVRNIDIPTGEFWIGENKKAPARMTASSARLFGKKRAATESFTTDSKDGRWQQDPRQLKTYGDRAFANGISEIIVHTYAHQPFMAEVPAMSLWSNGSNMNRTNTWWKMGGAWTTYLSRSQAVLQWGENVADILILSGEGSPNKAWYKEYPEITEAGFDYDYCSSDDVKDFLKVDNNGKVFAVENGSRYKIFALGFDNFLSVSLLKKVKKLLEDGATVVGIPPIDTPTLSDDKIEFKKIIDELWGGQKNGVRLIGKGKLIIARTPSIALKQAELRPDFLVPKSVKVVHRTSKDCDAFFVANISDSIASGDFKFAVPHNTTPEIWDASSGEIFTPTLRHYSNGHCVIPMSLLGRESKFVVFKKGDAPRIKNIKMSSKSIQIKTESNGDSFAYFSKNGKIEGEFASGKKFNRYAKTLPQVIDFSKDWRVDFQKNRGAPDFIDMKNLESLSNSEVDGVKYFSGIAEYSKNINVSSEFFADSIRAILNLGDVRNVAEVFVNGEKVATLWKYPFEVDITKFLKSGKNALKIRVANLWVNRIIGDNFAKSPREFPPKWILNNTQNNTDRYAWSCWNEPWKKGEPLLESGLIGPVELRGVAKIKLN